jgi:hypothetical protein
VRVRSVRSSRFLDAAPEMVWTTPAEIISAPERVRTT